MSKTRRNTPDIDARTGSGVTAKSWQTEAPMRMQKNDLHPDVAETPHELKRPTILGST